MNVDFEVFARRLRQARIKEKLSMDALCQKMEGVVSKQAISKYEAAKMMPSSTILIKLSDALKVDLDYFFQPFKFNMQEMQVSFRKKASVGQKDVEALKIHIQEEIERYLEIEEILGKEPAIYNKVVIDKVLSKSEDMAMCADLVRKEWQLGTDPIANVQDILEMNGLKVIFISGPEGFDGVSGMVNDSLPIIVLNKNIKMSERLRFTALHELGHLLFNANFAEDMSNHDNEKMCHAFASEMLLPSAIIDKTLGGKNKLSLNELIFLQEAYGISVDAIMHKLFDIGIVTEKRYKGFNIRKRVSPPFAKAVEESRFREESKTSRYQAMVYSALAQQLVTTSKAASMLGCSVADVRNNVNVI